MTTSLSRSAESACSTPRSRSSPNQGWLPSACGGWPSAPTSRTRVVTYAFGSKTALVEAVLHRASQRALDAVWAGDLPLDDFAESVRLSLHGLARDLRRHESEYRVVSELTASARAHPQLRAAAQSEIAASTRAIAESIERWSSMTGRALTTPTPVVAAALRASVDGLVEWWLSSHDERVLDDVVEVLASAFIGREADHERPHTAEEQGR